MKHSILFILTLSALLLVACTSNEEERVAQTTVLHIPFAVCEAPDDSNLATKSTGDPGVMENLPAPKYLYIWLESGGTLIHSFTVTNIYPSSWVKASGPERWKYTQEIKLPEGKDIIDDSKLQVYAIASQHPLEASWLSGLTTVDRLEAATFNLSSWQTSTAAAHSYALGNLYSTPLALMGSGNGDAAGLNSSFLNNGTYTVTHDRAILKFKESRPTRLYHCAAKADFKWEVASTLQPGVSVSTIDLSGLPTTLKVFIPTHNDGGSGTCKVLAATGAVNPLNVGNQWLGREYAYVLQPPTTTHGGDGKLTYDVEFTGKSKLENQQTSPATNPVFTTWYRINADIKN